MRSEWQKYKVEDFAEIVGGGTPSTKQDIYWGGDIPWLTPKDLSREYSRYVSRGERNISRAGLNSSSAHILPTKTILLTSRAPVGYVAIAKNAIATNQGFRNLVIRDGFDAEFIYYLLLNNTDYLKQHASGSTFQELSGSTLKLLEFLAPSYKEQRAIAHTLGSLDDKIELNRRMNKTLEAMARAIFKSWFVDFDPVRARAKGRDPGLPDEIAALFPDSFQDSDLGEIPKGWEVLPISSLLHINPRLKLSKGDVSKYVDMKALPTSGYSVSAVIEKSYKGGSKFQQDDVLLARITPCLENGKTALVDFLCGEEVAFGSTEFIVLRGKGGVTSQYVYCLARNIAFREHCISSMVGSSGRQRVQNACFDHFKQPVPRENILQVFAGQTESLFKNITANSQQIQTLSNLRDTLLPKLISGELRVPDAEKLVEGMV